VAGLGPRAARGPRPASNTNDETIRNHDTIHARVVALMAPRVTYDRVVTGRDGSFLDVLGANEEYAQDFHLAGLEPRAARGLAIVTCMDSRIEPLPLLGLRPGDAKILRNAGARVTDDVLRTLVLAAYLLGVDRAMVIAHTRCRMASGTEEDVHAAVAEAGGPDTRSLSFLVSDDQIGTLRADVQRVRSWPYLASLRVGGFLYDVDTGRVTQIC
jgi:carbonic anhydrase